MFQITFLRLKNECQGNFKEQIEKMVSLLRDISGNCCRKDQTYILYLVSNPRFKHLLEQKNLIFYTAYMNGISIMYDIAAIDPDLLITNINHIHQNFHFKRTLENNEQINFLDLLLIWKTFSSEVDIYRKSNITDNKHHFFSNHPKGHKIAVCRYFQPMYAFTPPFTDTKTKTYFTTKYLANVNNHIHTLMQTLTLKYKGNWIILPHTTTQHMNMDMVYIL